ncbi:MAG: hypothetical protein V3T31_02735, partial [candidate division Zixibacteria bacterium]
IRIVVTQANIDEDGDLVRVCLKSSSDNQLDIDCAYITKRDGTTGANGLINQDPSGLEVEDYHWHQQLYFGDGTGLLTEGVTIPAGSEKWSVWTAFPLRTDSDYLISLHIDPASVDDEYKYWEGSGTEFRTYYIVGGSYTTAGTPDWSGESATLDTTDIYVVSNIDVLDTTGTVGSRIFDTTLSAPEYNQIKWSESRPAGTDISLKARSSGSEYMEGVTAWDSITGSGANPHALSIGNGRYVQFLAELSAVPFWETGGSTLSYEDYVEEQVTNYQDYDFPESSGQPYGTEVSVPWVDDVETDWPGTTRMCAVTGYIAKKDSYGQATVMIDGDELLKVMNVHIRVSKEIQGRTVAEENYVEMMPRNTGR